MEFSHIRIIKNPKENQQTSTSSETFVQKTSFAAETEATLEGISSSEFPSISTLAGNLQGGTFAQRARAAELQAARARSELKSKNPQASPSPPARRVLKLKMPRRQKWTPLDLTETPGQNIPPITPELDSDNQNLEQLPVERQPVVNEQPVQESDVAVQIDQVTIDHNSNNRSEHITSRLYGSRPTSTLQSHDLAEYPAELGARISDNMPPRYNNSFQEDTSRLVGRGDHAMNDRFQRISSQHSAMNNQGRTAPQQNSQQNSSATFFDPMNLDQIEQELQNSFARVQGRQYNGPYVGPNIYQECADAISDPAILLRSESAKAALKKSFAAVRGTPAANHIAARFAATYPPPDNSYHIASTVHIPRNAEKRDQVPRKVSEQDKDFLRRQLNYLADETSHTNSQQNRHNAIPLNQEEEHFSNSSFTHGSQPPAWSGDQATQLAPQHVHQRGSYESGMIPPNIHHHGQYQPGRYHTGIWAPDRGYHGNRQVEDKAKSTAEEERIANEQEVADWWVRDNRVPFRAKYRIEESVRKEGLAMKQMSYLQGGSNHDKDIMEGKIKDPAAPYNNEDMVKDLLIPAIATLASYKSDRTTLNPFGKPPSWAIDHSPAGNQSFFSQQWGTPPQRVGRDPRYRAMQHDGRSSVFEDPTGRFPREEFSHGGGRWRPQ